MAASSSVVRIRRLRAQQLVNNVNVEFRRDDAPYPAPGIVQRVAFGVRDVAVAFFRAVARIEQRVEGIRRPLEVLREREPRLDGLRLLLPGGAHEATPSPA